MAVIFILYFICSTLKYMYYIRHLRSHRYCNEYKLVFGQSEFDLYLIFEHTDGIKPVPFMALTIYNGYKQYRALRNSQQ